MNNGYQIIDDLQICKSKVEAMIANTSSKDEDINKLNGVFYAIDLAIKIMVDACKDNTKGQWDFGKVQHTFNLHIIKTGLRHSSNINKEFFGAKHLALRNIFDNKIAIIG